MADFEIMRRTEVGGSGLAAMRATSEVEIDAVVESMTVANTVARARGSDKRPKISLERATTKMSEDAMAELLAEATSHDRATHKIDSDELRSLGVVSVGETRRAPQAPAPETIQPAKFEEHPPVSSIEVERGYEKALAKRKLTVDQTDAADGEDNGVTIPLEVFRDAAAIAIPKSVLAVAPGTPAKQKPKDRDLKGFAVGLFIGLASVLGVVMAMS